MHDLKQLRDGEFLYCSHNIPMWKSQLCGSGMQTDPTVSKPINLDYGEEILVAKWTAHLLNNNYALIAV